MLKLLKKLFKKEPERDYSPFSKDYVEKLEREEEERERLREIYTSDLYQYKYENDKQKIVKQIYPNDSNIQVLIGFYKRQEDGDRTDNYYIEKYIPDHYVYKLNNNLITKPKLNIVKDQLQGISVQIGYDREEVLNRSMRRHHKTLEKTSPTIPDRLGDNLHDGLLVVEQDPEQDISKKHI